MMGQFNGGTAKLFYEFSLEEMVPQNHFTYDEAKDVLTCPVGKELRQFWRDYKVPRNGITKDKKRLYRSRNTDCAACVLKDKRCPTAPFKEPDGHNPSRFFQQYYLTKTLPKIQTKNGSKKAVASSGNVTCPIERRRNYQAP